MKLYGVTLTFNEEKTIPYIMPYYVRLGYDKLIVYDNQSTDNTVQLLKNYPFVEVRDLDTGGKLDSEKLRLVKQEAYKEFLDEKDSAWMTVTDFDEVIFYNSDESFKDLLARKEKEDYKFYSKTMIEPLSERWPNLSNGKLCHENISFAHEMHPKYWSKTTLFNIHTLYRLEYFIGNHSCNIYFDNVPFNDLKDEKKLFSFHLKFLDNEFLIEKNNKRANSLSENDIKNGFNREIKDLANREYFYNLYLDKLKEGFYLEAYINKETNE